MTKAASMGIERIRVNVGSKFRLEKPAHVDKVLTKIATEHGEGFELDGYEPSEGVAIFKRESNTLVASHAGNDSMEIRLPQDTKQSDGKKRAVSLADTYPGYQMTTFEPHRRRAIISKLTEEVIRARDAISNALSVDPWNIQVAERTDGRERSSAHRQTVDAGRSRQGHRGAGDPAEGHQIFRSRDDLVIRFQFVEDHRDTHEVKRMCQVLRIHRFSYYKWQAGRWARHQRQQADDAVVARIRDYHHQWDQTLG